MKRENGECYVVIISGIRENGKRVKYRMVPTAAHMRVEPGKMFFRLISADGKEFFEDYVLDLSEVNDFKIKKRLLGYSIFMTMSEDRVYRINSNYYVPLIEDKNQRDDLIKIIDTLSNS